MVTEKRNGIPTVPRFQKLFLVRLIVSIAFCSIILYSYLLTDFFQDVLHQFPRVNKYRSRHTILLWTPYFEEPDWLPSTKDLNCTYQNCDITSNRDKYNVSSAVILHWRDIKTDDLPTCSYWKPNAMDSCPLWVLFNKEAPPHTPSHVLEKISNKIHWTVTYRQDSDIVSKYGDIVPRKVSIDLPNINLNRSNICWLVSNCATASKREDYVANLQKFINVQIYGRCGKHICPNKTSLECYRYLSQDCKFYLSFENSICKDYSTEKLYNAMKADMVPIVYGGDNYHEHLPPNSFINVDDFSSPQNLAEYLKDILQNDTKYLSYFQWRTKYSVRDASYRWHCDLCEKLNKVQLEDLKPHDNTKKWWFEQSNCKNIFI